MHEPVRSASVVEYPSADGKPVAETDLHFQRLIIAALGEICGLEAHLRKLRND